MTSRTVTTGMAPRCTVLLLAAVLAAACEAGPPAFGGAEDAAAVDVAQDSATVLRDSTAVLTPAPAAVVADVDTTVNAEADSALVASADAESEPTDGAAETAARPPLGPEASDGRFPRPEHVRGIYLNAWASGSRNRVTALLELAAQSEVNAFVIDIKDATGYISHPTDLAVAKEIGATEEVRIRDLPGLLARLDSAGIYPIARIVIVKDPLLAAGRPDFAVQDTAGGAWVDSKGIVWMNPYNKDVWEYHVDLAREVAEMGFPEIQWDYVRFADAPAADHARSFYPGENGSKPDAIRAFLEYSRDELAPLGVAVTADVFGVTTSASRDVGIGQVWESFIDVIDVALPMVYPSHYWEGSFGIETPNAYPYEIVNAALRDAVRRSEDIEGAGITRPWLQDFSLGEPLYEAPEVRAQIQATYDAGLHEWILWNPGSRYTEGALEPVGGFSADPLIRLANGLFPASRRFEVLDSVTAAKAAAAAAAADTTRTALPVDTVRGR
jgi:hypothetical protein